MYGGFAAGLLLLLLCTVQFQRETGKGGEEGSQYVKPTYVSSKFNNCCPFEWHHFGHVDFFGQWQNNNTLSRGGVYWKSPGPLWPLGANCLRGHIFQFIPTRGSVLPFFFPERGCIWNYSRSIKKNDLLGSFIDIRGHLYWYWYWSSPPLWRAPPFPTTGRILSNIVLSVFFSWQPANMISDPDRG